MATHGSLSEFNANVETWSSYTERLGHYFEANDITDASKKRALLLTACGPSTYQLLKNLLQPLKPSDKNYSEIVKILDEHFSPAPSPIVQRYKFNTRMRKSGESVFTYITELKACGEHCDYGDQLHDMIRDRLVCGINDTHIQRRLLQEPKLTYKKAQDIALAMELAARDVSDILRNTTTTQPIQRLQQSTRKSDIDVDPTMNPTLVNLDQQNVMHVEKRPHSKSLPQQTPHPECSG